MLSQNLDLGRLKECWDVAYALNSPETWQRLATAAMEALDIELALRIYRQLGDAAMVLGLEKVLQVRKEKPTELLPLKRLSNVHGSTQRVFNHWPISLGHRCCGRLRTRS